MEKLTDVLSAPDYMPLVYAAYAVTALVMGTCALLSLRGLVRAKRSLAEVQSHEA